MQNIDRASMLVTDKTRSRDAVASGNQLVLRTDREKQIFPSPSNFLMCSITVLCLILHCILQTFPESYALNLLVSLQESSHKLHFCWLNFNFRKVYSSVKLKETKFIFYIKQPVEITSFGVKEGTRPLQLTSRSSAQCYGEKEKRSHQGQLQSSAEL